MAVFVLHCMEADYNASTGQCAAPFYGPASSFPPPIDATEGLILSVAIAGMWGVGFMIRQARRAAGG